MIEETRNKFSIKRFFSITRSYEKLPSEDLSEDEVESGSSEDKNATSTNATRSQVYVPLAILTLLAVSLAAALWAWPTIKTLPSTFGVPINRCSNGNVPTIRREWRTLTEGEQINYISAIQCLRNSQSHFFPDRGDISRYMDFVYAHYENLFGMHHAAGFLPWHRWLLALFEQSLRDECEYEGSMPYWDWSLDWNDPGRSPVFDETFGFGGDGNPTRESTILNGSCVTTGPFANMMIPKFPEASPGEEHCLSREFGWKHGAHGDKLRKDFLRGVLQEATFWNFTRAFERGPHDTIHWYIGGVLPTVYSPADSIFYLHHGQIDRLWAIWQKAAPGHGTDYAGYYTLNTDAPARKDDIIPSKDLARNVTVADILDIEGDLLCYQYDSYNV